MNAGIWFSTHQLAKVLDFTVNHVAKLCRAGEFPNARKDHRSWQVPLDDVDAFHSRRRQIGSGVDSGVSPRQVGITRDQLRTAVYRAYMRSDRCPPDCPGRDDCLFGTCALLGILEG